MIFCLTHCNGESMNQTFFESANDDVVAFRKTCDHLMRVAAQDALEGRFQSPMNSPQHLLGYDALLWEVRARLPQYGYQQVTLEGAEYSLNSIFWPKPEGSNYLDDVDSGHEEHEATQVLGADLLHKIGDHNRKILMSVQAEKGE